MNQQLELLVQLQKKDELLFRVQQRITKIPDELKALQADLLAAKTAVDTAKDEVDGEQKKLRQLESEVEQLKANLSKSKQKLPDVKTNKEYSSLLSEIENLNGRIRAAEDQELEQMEEIERHKKIIPEKEALVREEEKIYNEAKSVKEPELERVKEEFENEKKKRDRLLEIIESELLSTYSTLLVNKDGVAVCNLEGDICRGCDMEVPPQFAIDVRKGEDVLYCPQCGRILYSIQADKS